MVYKMIEVVHIGAAANCTYNCHELTPNYIFFASHCALCVYDLEAQKVLCTSAQHEKRINCVRLLKTKNGVQFDEFISAGMDGKIAFWKWDPFTASPCDGLKNIACQNVCESSIIVCDGIVLDDVTIFAFLENLSSNAQVWKLSRNNGGATMVILQNISLGRSVAQDILIHIFPPEENSSLCLAIAMDSGDVTLHHSKVQAQKVMFENVCRLRKHEDWVRALSMVTLANGDILLASGGQDSFIAIWRFTLKSLDDPCEFQIHKFLQYNICFDSMVIGHEGWINSLSWNRKGQLISCSSDQSTVIWDFKNDMWIESERFGAIGGLLPGGYGAKFCGNLVTCLGFQGAIQIWEKEDDNWVVRPSITGHFAPITDVDYGSSGKYVISCSLDQTTRVHASCGLEDNWHEISRPQIHGHDIFTAKLLGNLIVSGSEEKILRVFQCTEVFRQSLHCFSDVTLNEKDVSSSASLPALGLSNQSNVGINSEDSNISDGTKLDEDFLRGKTLWVEIAKLYGHVYEIAAIATCNVNKLVASGSQSSKPQFSSIIIWCGLHWKKIGEFSHHKLNVTGLEFSRDGKFLLSVSRDRTWAVWDVIVPGSPDERKDIRINVIYQGSGHSRVIWFGVWSPCTQFFITGGRDKKINVWKLGALKFKTEDNHPETSVLATAPVTAGCINSTGKIVVGMETGSILVYSYSTNTEKTGNINLDLKTSLNQSIAHHSPVKKVSFNPRNGNEFVSVGADHILKIYRFSEEEPSC